MKDWEEVESSLEDAFTMPFAPTPVRKDDDLDRNELLVEIELDPMEVSSMDEDAVIVVAAALNPEAVGRYLLNGADLESMVPLVRVFLNGVVAARVSSP